MPRRRWRTLIQLRDYQREAVETILAEYRKGVTRQLVVLPTGTGKTIIFSRVIASFGEGALVLAHRDELIEQAVDKMLLVWPDADIGVVKAGRNELGHRVTVASVQTLAHRKRLDELVDACRGRLRITVVDEAHHAIATQWLAALRTLYGGPRSLLLGFTATPNRTDKVGLGTIFQKVVYQKGILEMISAGYLVKPNGVSVKTNTDISQIKEKEGDFRDSALENVINTANRNQLIEKAFSQYAPQRKAIVFTAGVKHAHDLAGVFQASGTPAAAVDGSMRLVERRRVVQDLKSGAIQVVANCGVLTEGFDEPSVDCIVLARPTKSQSLYIQQIGRGLRPYPSKRDCLVIDVADLSGRHRLVQLADLIRVPNQQGGRKGESAGGGPAQMILDAKPVGKGLVAKEVSLVTMFTWNRIRGVWLLALPDKRAVILKPAGGGYLPVMLEGYREAERMYDKPVPIEWAQGIAENRVRELHGAQMVLLHTKARWRDSPATEGQLKLLENWKVPFQPGLTKGEASELVTRAVWETRMRQLGYGA